MSPINRPALPNQSKSNDGYCFMSSIDSSKYDLQGAVKLPDREDRNEWIANNLFDFHKQICMLYGTISQYCTREKCPEMTAGLHKYLWSHGPERKPVDLFAAQYIHHSLDWIQEQLDNDDVFPSMSVDKDFPENFEMIAKTIARRLFRVLAHVYHNHLPHVRLLKEEAHMNTSLKHFIYFVREFDLVTTEELSPLKDYIEKLDLLALGTLHIDR